MREIYHLSGLSKLLRLPTSMGFVEATLLGSSYPEDHHSVAAGWCWMEDF
jgi:hypothetical protein